MKSLPNSGLLPHIQARLLAKTLCNEFETYPAALALETGCDWVTCDRGFDRFPGLRWEHQLD